MPRKKKKTKVQKNSLKQIRWTESYISLVLGAIVVLLIMVLVVAFTRNKTMDRISTSESTSELTQEEKSESPGTYEVKKGDTLWSISEKTYGSGFNWTDIAKENKIQTPNSLEEGTKLNMPNAKPRIEPAAEVASSTDDQSSISGEKYTVVEGDHLWGISVRKYGDGYRWPELARANSIPNPDLIYAGSMLKLPR